MMTEPSLFWVDPSEISVLLREAGVSSAARTSAARTPVAPTSAVRTPARTKPTLAADANPSRVHGSDDDGPGLPPFTIPGGSFEDRLLALLEWVRRIAVFEHAFVVDREGLALVHESAPLELIAAAAELSENWETLRKRFDLSTRSHLAIDLGRSHRLHLFGAKSPWGLLSLGFVTGDRVSSTSITAIQQQFRRTLEIEGAK